METPEEFVNRLGKFPMSRTQREEQNRRADAALETVCRRAKAEGKHGVKVTSYFENESILIEVSDEVPFGEVQYHTTHYPSS